MQQFNQIDFFHMQHNIAGGNLGGFHQILRQMLQSLGFLVQNFDIALDRLCFDIFPF